MEWNKKKGSFPSDSVVKKSACNAGNPGLIAGLGRYAGEGNPSGILAWKIPRTEKPGRHSLRGHTRLGHNFVTKHYKRNRERKLNRKGCLEGTLIFWLRDVAN